MTEPTDNELQALWSKAVLPDTVTKRLAFSFARAVLAKFAKPPAVAGDPVARSVEAEVRKDDEALIRQLVEALENHDGNYKLSKSAGAAVDAAITAARARLEKSP